MFLGIDSRTDGLLDEAVGGELRGTAQRSAAGRTASTLLHAQSSTLLSSSRGERIVRSVGCRVQGAGHLEVGGLAPATRGSKADRPKIPSPPAQGADLPTDEVCGALMSMATQV